MLKNLSRMIGITFIVLKSFIWAVLTACAAPLLLIAAGVLAVRESRKGSGRRRSAEQKP